MGKNSTAILRQIGNIVKRNTTIVPRLKTVSSKERAKIKRKQAPAVTKEKNTETEILQIIDTTGTFYNNGH